MTADTPLRRSAEYWAVLAAVMTVSICYYGVRAAAVYALSAVTAVAADFLCLFLRRRHYRTVNLTGIASALVLAMMLPATVPFSIVVLSVFLSVAAGLHLFGGRRDLLFPPPAIGYLFATICWPQEVLRFPEPGAAITLFRHTAVLNASFSRTALMTGTVREHMHDQLIGAVCGPMGATCILLLAVALFILMVRGGVDMFTVPGYLFTAWAVSLLCGHDPMEMTVLGMSLFTLLFMTGDPAVMPCTGLFAMLAAALTGALSAYLSAVYSLEYAAVAAVILTCPVWRGIAVCERWLRNPPADPEEEVQAHDA